MRHDEKDGSVSDSPSSVRPEPVEGLPSSSAEKDTASTSSGQTDKAERRKLGVRFG